MAQQEKMCPLLGKLSGATTQPYLKTNRHYCQGEDCAWWDPTEEACAVLLIGAAVAEMAGKEPPSITT